MADTVHGQPEFEEYFAARHQFLRRTAYLLCGDWAWADDLAQIAFVRLAAAWERIREPAAVDAFVRTCLVRAYLSETRRAWRRREASMADPPDVNLTDPTADLDPRERATFLAALRHVPPRQRAVLVYRYYQGLDVEQTAAALGCSAGTVKSQTARGLAALREALGVSPTDTT